MGDKTTISWCDSSWNPWMGCQKVSPGCANCYMFRDQERYGRDPSVVVRAADATFRAPLKWKHPRFVFTCSWSDFFHPDADPWRAEAWEIIRQTPQHTYQILTKRIERVRFEKVLPADWGEGWPNVWLGASVENQRMVARRAYTLCQIPARIRFLSCEPLLGGLDLTMPYPSIGHYSPIEQIQWIIAGGESGPDHRPMHLLDLRMLVEQCQRYSVPVWVKQDSGKLPGQRGRIPDDLWIQERPARAA